MSAYLVAVAWTELLYVDLVQLGGFKAVRRIVHCTSTRKISVDPSHVQGVVDAVRVACALYIRPALCLQRSAAVTRLLRRRGIAADLVIGYQLPPLKAHAWVEVAGDVVSDGLDDLELFKVLDRW